MTPSFITMDYYKTKLYQTENSSKRFLELSEQQLIELSKKVYQRKETTEKNPKALFERYQQTLQYLTDPYINRYLKTFDERIAYLIMMTDPNLIIFKEFLKIDLISMTEIVQIEDEIERNRLKQIRAETILAYESAVRKKIGFFDTKLLKYEELFFKRYFNEKELLTEIGKNSLKNLIIKAKALKNFDNISDKRYQELIDIAQIWLSLSPDKDNLNSATYSVTNQKKLLGINTLAEELALFILLIDSNLDMLRIYEEESMMPIIESRITEQFGFFHQELLVLEQKFHHRFCPTKQLSIWTKTKKV